MCNSNSDYRHPHVQLKFRISATKCANIGIQCRCEYLHVTPARRRIDTDNMHGDLPGSPKLERWTLHMPKIGEAAGVLAELATKTK
eukprot:SAG31_NODE_45760_length_257_cov_0.981013_1_plen_85_part_11